MYVSGHNVSKGNGTEALIPHITGSLTAIPGTYSTQYSHWPSPRVGFIPHIRPSLGTVSGIHARQYNVIGHNI